MLSTIEEIGQARKIFPLFDIRGDGAQVETLPERIRLPFTLLLLQLPRYAPVLTLPFPVGQFALSGPTGHPPLRGDRQELTFTDLRTRTLQRIAEASSLFRALTAADLATRRVKFSDGGTYSEYPLWNLINGPIADALYHTGQLVTFRRTIGNPADPRVNHFRGKLTD
ncbi:hypothetical protein [Lewinella sp. IMCC34191]|uniref:hypothetical protein n=1 Tax=Lewinella sp. IMCC34191 TaxID=2259172 RepID=UPI0013008E59|nr:hypothetical protein [Lewinella sp. IMCC34191]